MSIYPSHQNFQPKTSLHSRNLRSQETQHHMDLKSPTRFDTTDRFHEFQQMGTDEHHVWLKQHHQTERALGAKANKMMAQIEEAASQAKALDQSPQDLDSREGVVLFENQEIGGKLCSGSVRPGTGAFLDADGGWSESSYFPDQNKPYIHIAADDGSQTLELFEGPLASGTWNDHPDSTHTSDEALSTYIFETPETRLRAEVGHSRMHYVGKAPNWFPHYEDDTDYPTRTDRLGAVITTNNVEEYQPTLLEKLREIIGL